VTDLRRLQAANAPGKKIPADLSEPSTVVGAAEMFQKLAAAEAGTLPAGAVDGAQW
jgi:hypothetical protein